MSKNKKNINKGSSGTTIKVGEVDSLEMRSLIFPLSSNSEYYERIEEMYIRNMLLQKIVKIIPEDAFRRTIKANSGDEKLDENVNKMFNDLDCKNKAIESLNEMLKQGDSGVLSIIQEFGVESDLSTEMPKKFKDLLDFNVYTRFDITSIKKQNDLSKKGASKIDKLRMKLSSTKAYKEIDKTRFHHLQYNYKRTKTKTDYYSNQEFGNSIFVSMQDPINTYRKIYEGISNAAFRGNIVVYKTDKSTLDKINNYSPTEKKQFNDKFSKKSVHIIGSDDAIEVVNGGSGFPGEVFQKVAEKYIANLLDIPDSRWLGSQTGATTSSNSDIERYDDKIENFMEVYGMPLLKFMFDIIYKSFNRFDISYEIDLGELHKLTAEEEAKVNELNSKSVKNYTDAMSKLSIEAKNLLKSKLEEKFNGSFFDRVLRRIKGG